MYATALTRYGGPDVLTWTGAPDPQPGPGEVLLNVAAAGVNRADVLQRQGFYPPPAGASDILGLECAGTVTTVGADVTTWAAGDRVCALLAGGGYAEQVVVPAGQLLPIPNGVDMIAAAGLPEIACTVWSTVVMAAGLTAGERLLVHGGGSGIGTHAIQVAVALGAKVAVTAGSRYKLDRCAELGADLLVNYREEDFVAALRQDGRGGADVVLDNMGAAYLARNIEAMAADGRLVVLGMQGGVTAELDLSKLMAKRGTIHAMGLRARPVDGPAGKAEIVAQVRDRVWPMIAAGTIKPIVSAVLPITQAGRAHELLDSAETVGKVVLTVA